ncbi:MAG: S8 family serine peptidase, partial [Euryarchaeota archaeon]|nr:S8 family serine peptidase [Euryarchaeota archaeon]
MRMMHEGNCIASSSVRYVHCDEGAMFKMQKQGFFNVGLAMAIVVAMMLTAFGGLNFTKAQYEESDIGIVYLKNDVGHSILDNLGIEIIETFDEFQLARLTPTMIRALGRQGIEASIINDRTTISMITYAFDTIQGDPAIPESLKAGDSCSLYIIQFIGPVKATWIAETKALGIEIDSYIPNNAFLTRGSPVAIAGALGLNFVQWAGKFHPAYKFTSEMIGGKTRVTVWNGPDVSSTLDSIQELFPGTEYSYVDFNNHYEMIVDADTSQFETLAVFDDVIWLEHVDENVLYGETASEITGGIWTANSPYGGYGNYANLQGWDGTNVVVAVADTGIGTGVAGNAGHIDFNGRVVGGVDYTGTGGGTFRDGYGHGTHTAGTIAANGNTGTGTRYGATNYYVGAGIAPDARLFGQKIFTDAGSGTGIPTTQAGWDTLFQAAYNGGAYVHSNSWGENPGDSAYEANDIYYDQHVRDSATSTGGQQAMIITVAAGNAGSGAGTIGSPASGKNVITTGASENYHPDGTSYGNLGANADSNDINTIIGFSSRGLDDDTKIKPDIASPGTGIVSTRSAYRTGGSLLYGYYTPDTRYEWCSGTSMSNPNTAGSSAVIVDWWQAGHGGTRPMPAMVKALLINTAIDMGTADIPNANEGWGRSYLPTIVNPTVNVQNYDNPQALSTGQTWSVPISYQSAAQPLKITMVYTDAPGTALANPALVNNLNLRVTSPLGQIWYGNSFSNGYSTSGTAAGNTNIAGENWDRNADNWDDVNNVECVYIPTGQLQAGTYTVEVIGYNVPTTVTTGGQDFAITIYNAQPPGTTATADGPIGGPTNVAAVTLTYTWTGSPTSVNLYYTKNGGASWTFAINDATVDGSRTYTIAAGSGTYGWLASAVGGGSTESSPPIPGTPPEATSYILDVTAPAAPTAPTVEHYGNLPGSVVVEGFQASNGGATASANLVLTAPSGITAGELLMLIVGNSDNTATAQFSNNLAGWNFVGTSGSATPDAHIGAFWRVATGAEGQVTVVAQSADYWFGWYIRLSGVDTGSPINAQNFDTSATSANPHNIPEITTIDDNSLVIYGLSYDGGDGVPFSVAGAGWSESDEQQCSIAATTSSGCWGTKVQTIAGATGIATVTAAVADGASFFQIAIKPAPGAGTLADNTLNWTHSGTDVSQYVIYRSDISTGPWDVAHVIDTVPVGTNTYCDIGRGQADATLWWYVVRAEDAVGNRETNVNSEQEPGFVVSVPYDIDLTGRVAGDWAFVSFPIAISGNIETILDDPATDWDVAKYWDASVQRWMTYRKGATTNTFTIIDNQMGVWVHLTAVSGSKLTTGVAGDYPSSQVQITLYAGWNMVGYPSQNPMTANLALAGTGATIISVYTSTTPYI